MTGHSITTLDPLGINNADLDSSIPAELVVTNAGECASFDNCKLSLSLSTVTPQVSLTMT